MFNEFQFILSLFDLYQHSNSLGWIDPFVILLVLPLPSVYSHRLSVSNLAFAYTHFELIERYPRTMLHCTSEINNTRRIEGGRRARGFGD